MILLRTLLLLRLLYTIQPARAQPVTPADYGLKAYVLQDKQLGEIRFYITQKDIGKKKPLLLALEGSGHFPMTLLVQAKNKEWVLNTIDISFLEWASRYHVVYIGKPGVPFCDTVYQQTEEVDMAALEAALPTPPEYTRRASLQWRAGAASKVLNYVCARFPVDTRKVVAYGYSEGGQVVPTVAVQNKKVTHCASIVGSGLNQFYDNIVTTRVMAAKGELSHQAAQQRIDSLLRIFADIYAHPTATDKAWEGHSYLRWASYCNTIPIDQLKQLSIPIFMAVGTNDTNSPIYGLDYVPLEFLRLGKTNLTYKAFPGSDHYFNETILVNGTPQQVAHKAELMEALQQWLGD